jgi:hypothetical protein
MAKWKTEAVAYLTSASTTGGKIMCAICPWTHTLESATPFPAADDAVQEHVAAIHPNHINDAGIQKAPLSYVRHPDDQLEDAELVYYILVGAVTAN